MNSEQPTVEGKPQVGVQLAADRGTWSPKGTFRYQWLAGGDPIDGATSSAFTPTADQLGHGVKVRVTLKAPGYTTMRVKSDKTPDVAPGRFIVSTPPTISGVRPGRPSR